MEDVQERRGEGAFLPLSCNASGSRELINEGGEPTQRESLRKKKKGTTTYWY